MKWIACTCFGWAVIGPTHAWLSSPQTSPTLLHRRRSHSRLAATSSNQNVVLQPSDDPARFDSFQIGNARVHRYSLNTDPESQTEYVMWYHGRDAQFDSDRALPPLSTGRIGRAKSKNGLIWVKDEQGNFSEDVPDVSLGLNKESWWGFDTAHVGLGNVLLPMSTPAVMTEGGVYLMYYMGGSFEETRMADYLDDSKIPDNLKDATIKGMNLRIGVAVSQDGVSWGRVEGDDPTGACMVPYNKADPNQAGEPVPANMPEELYCGWPEVVVNLVSGNKAEAFLMFYSTMLKETKEKVIAYAISEDGFRWFKKGLCLQPDKDGMDAAGCARCCVVRDASFDEETLRWTEIDSWKMYYEGISLEDNKHRIMMATSIDAQNWHKKGVILDVGAEEDAWDVAGVGSPHLVRCVCSVTRSIAKSLYFITNSFFFGIRFAGWMMVLCECTTRAKARTEVQRLASPNLFRVKPTVNGSVNKLPFRSHKKDLVLQRNTTTIATICMF